MLSPLIGLDSIQAMGILARAALALSSGFGPTGAPLLLPHEYELRRQLYEIAATQTDLASADDDPQKVADWLSDQLDAMSSDNDVDQTLLRLSEKALLSSDEYDVEFTQQFRESVTAQPDDQKVALYVVKNPDDVSDYGLGQDDMPSMQMLLGRWIGTPSDRSFHMAIIVCAKDGPTLKIFDIWRVLPSKVDLFGSKNVLEIYRKFCTHYGFNVRLGEKKGKFIEYARTSHSDDGIRARDLARGIQIDASNSKDFILTALMRNVSDGAEWSFVAAIDTNRYLKDLRVKGVTHNQTETRA